MKNNIFKLDKRNTLRFLLLCLLYGTGTVAASTLCPDSPDSCVIDQLPYVQKFNNSVGGFLPCWYRMNGDSSYFGNIHITTQDSVSYLSIQSNYYASSQYVALPSIDETLADTSSMFLFLDYSSQIKYYNFSHELGLMTNPNDPSTFSRICYLPRTPSNQLATNKLAIALNNLGAGQHIAVKTNIPASDNDHTWIYSVEIDHLPECGLVYNASWSRISGYGALLKWDYLPGWSDDSTVFTIAVYRDSDTSLVDVITTRKQQALIHGLQPNYTYYTAVITPTCGEGTDTASSTRRDTVTFCTGFLSQCNQPLLALSECSGDSATIQWVPQTGDTAWNIYIMNGAYWDLLESHYRDSSYTLHNLQPGVTYTVRVTSLCDIYGEWLFNTLSFYPKCQTEIVPYYESFDRSDLNCWENPTDPISLFSRTILRIPPQRPTVLPVLDQPLNTLAISGEMIGSGLIVGIVPEGGILPNDFLPLDTLNNVYDTCWESFYYSFSHSPHTTGRIVLMNANPSVSTLQMIYIDNLFVNIDNGCPRPCHLYDSAITAHSALLGWQSEGDVWSYEVEYGPNGFEHGTGTTLTVMNTPITLSGLNSGSNYEVYIRSRCSDGDSSIWSFPINFTTSCSDISSLPWYEDFDSWYDETDPSHRPPCWSYYNYRNYSRVGMYRLSDGNTAKALWLHQETSSLPRLGRIIRTQTLQTSLTAWHDDSFYSNYDSPLLIVGVSHAPTNPSSFTPIDTLHLTKQPTTYNVAFNNYSDTGRYVTLKPIFNINETKVLLDDISIDILPDCISPYMLSVDSIGTTEATLHWIERGSATEWEIEYGLHGFQSGTRIVTANNTFILSGLIPNNEYEYRVRSICNNAGPYGWSDTSEWSYQSLTFTTFPTPAQVPYHCDFEDTIEYRNWVDISKAPFAWRRSVVDTSSEAYGYSFVFNNDSNQYRDNLIINGTLFRDIDFGPRDTMDAESAYSHTLIFRHKAGIMTGPYPAHYSNHAHCRAVLCINDLIEPLAPSNSLMMSPWGPIDSLVVIADSLLYDDWSFSFDSRENASNNALYDTWVTDTIELTDLYGVHRLTFFISSSFKWDSILFFTIDDIHIIPTSCPKPTNLHVVDIGAHSANLAWRGLSDGQYLVSYHPIDMPDSLMFDTVEGRNITLVGLSPLITYSAQVQLMCDSGVLSNPSSIVFTTLLCDSLRCDSAAVDSSIGNRSSLLPVSFSDSYSYSQQIFPASCFAGAGTINAINLSYTLTDSGTSVNNYTVFLGHTDKQAFSNNDDFVDPVQMSLVYTGPLPTADGWAKIILQAPFYYNGESNLVLAIGNSANTAKPMACLVNPTPHHSSILLRSSTPINASSLYSLQHEAGLRSSHPLHCQAIFEFCPACACASPTILPPLLRVRHCTLRWRDLHADAYQLSYRSLSNPQWDTTFTITDTSFHIAHVVPDQDYVYRVRQICTDTSVHQWAYGYFRTSPSLCPIPENLHLADLNPDGATLQWTPDDDFLFFNLHVFNSVFDTLITTSDSLFTIQRLYYGVVYKAAVQANCFPGMPAGEWSDTISFTTPTCPDVTNLTYTNLRSNSVDLDWLSEDTISLWEISYGPRDFHYQQGTSIFADHHPYTLTNLESEMEYDVYVRSVCGSGFPSEHWSNVISFTTQYAGIESRPTAYGFSISPNPTKSHLTVTLGENIEGPARLTVRDAQGRTVHQTYLAPDTRQIVFTMNSETISSAHGIYFITITASNFSGTRKFIVE